MRAALTYQRITRDADRHIAGLIAAQIARDVGGQEEEPECAGTGLDPVGC